MLVFSVASLGIMTGLWLFNPISNKLWSTVYSDAFLSEPASPFSTAWATVAHLLNRSVQPSLLTCTSEPCVTSRSRCTFFQFQLTRPEFFCDGRLCYWKLNQKLCLPRYIKRDRSSWIVLVLLSIFIHLLHFFFWHLCWYCSCQKYFTSAATTFRSTRLHRVNASVSIPNWNLPCLDWLAEALFVFVFHPGDSLGWSTISPLHAGLDYPGTLWYSGCVCLRRYLPMQKSCLQSSKKPTVRSSA